MTREQKKQFTNCMNDAIERLERAVALAGIHSLSGQHALACADFAKIKMHEVYGQADGDDFRAWKGNLIDMANAVDPAFNMLGQEARDNATRHFDMTVFDRIAFNAVDGNALYELTNAADNADEDAAMGDENDRADHHYKLERGAVL